jgi:preprotein translocase subunit SecE
MLNEDKEDKGDTEDYRRNLMAKPDHGLFKWTSNSIKELNKVMVCLQLSLY